MFNVGRMLVMIAVLALTGGCFQVETTVRVNPDGSGTLEERVLFSRKLVAQIEEIGKAFAGPEEKPKPFELYDVEKLRKRAATMGPGTAFVESSPINDPAYTGYRAVYSFSDINRLRMNSDFSEAMADQGGAGPAEPGKDVAFRFVRGPESRLQIILPENGKSSQEAAGKDETKAGPKDESPALTPEQKQEMAAFFKGMRFSMAVEVNGRVVNSTASHLKGNRITLFDFDFDRLGLSLDELQKLKPAGGGGAPSLADAKEILAKLPGVAVELKDRVEISFTK